jgi:hypothetical protein
MPIQASPLPSALIGEWLWTNRGTDGTFLYLQRLDVLVNADSTGKVTYASQRSQIGGNDCVGAEGNPNAGDATETDVFTGTWFVNGQQLVLNAMLNHTVTFQCAPGLNGTTSQSGTLRFPSFSVNGNTLVVTPPAALQIRDFGAPSGAPLLNSISLARIGGPSTTLFSSVLPSSRSVQVGKTATAFATIINSGGSTATGCAIAPVTSVPANFTYQTTNPTTNALTGSANTPIDIAPGKTQTFFIGLAPTAAFNPTNIVLGFTSTNTASTQTISGVNTLLLSASATPVPDIVALAATASNDGIVHVPGSSGTAAFAVATVNVGAGSSITASANTGGVALPLTISLCQTDPQSGQCISAIGSSVTFTDNAGATPTVAVFVTASGTVPFDPANNRIFVEFTDPGGTVRGATSVAVETQ